MKSLLFLIIIALSACGTRGVKDELPGTYFNHTDGKFSTATNTLVISLYDHPAGTYRVKYLSHFQRKKDGALQPPDSIEKTLVFLYNEQTQQLEEPTSGKVISFSPDKQTLLYGAAEYRKVK